MCWVREWELSIKDLLHYVDDAFNVTFSESLTFYAPYNHHIPSNQVHFLCLLDDIGIPHEDMKQQFGSSLEIIGLTVDLQTLSVTMP